MNAQRYHDPYTILRLMTNVCDKKVWQERDMPRDPFDQKYGSSAEYPVCPEHMTFPRSSFSFTSRNSENILQHFTYNLCFVYGMNWLKNRKKREIRPSSREGVSLISTPRKYSEIAT